MGNRVPFFDVLKALFIESSWLDNKREVLKVNLAGIHALFMRWIKGETSTLRSTGIWFFLI